MRIYFKNLKIIYQRHRALFWFSCAGSIAFIIDFLSLWFLTYIGFNIWFSRALSFIVAATFTWIFNSHISFAGRNARLKKFSGWISYIALASIGGSINYVSSLFVIKQFSEERPEVLFFAVAVGSFLGLFANYLMNHYIFFKK
ncbi:GtrA family protein [Bartonella tamiae]|nr:GtrA family protein [Bartonella tamiae]